MQIYTSEWTNLPASTTLIIPHPFGILPAFVSVQVASFLPTSEEEKPEAPGYNQYVPHTDYNDHSIHILHVTTEYVLLKNTETTNRAVRISTIVG